MIAKKTSYYPNGRIQLIVVAFIEKFSRDSFLNQITLNKDKLTIIIGRREHLDKQFTRGFINQAKELAQDKQVHTDTEWVCQVVGGLIDSYANFYTNIVVDENRAYLDTLEVSEALQMFRYKMSTAALYKEQTSKQE